MAYGYLFITLCLELLNQSPINAAKIQLFSEKIIRMLADLKKMRTFAPLSSESTSENRSFGEVAEWSIAAVLKTVVLRGTRGSNPCLSAELTGQNRTMNSQVPQIQRFVGPFLSPYICPTGHHLDPKRQSCNLTRTPDN